MAFRPGNDTEMKPFCYFRITQGSVKLYRMRLVCHSTQIRVNFLDMSVLERIQQYIWNNMHLPQMLLFPGIYIAHG